MSLLEPWTASRVCRELVAVSGQERDQHRAGRAAQHLGPNRPEQNSINEPLLVSAERNESAAFPLREPQDRIGGLAFE